MKHIASLFLALITVTTTLYAQDFQGMATYRTHRKIDIKMDSTKLNDAMQTQMMEMLKKQFQKTYTLTFDQFSSIYKQEVELAKPQVGDGFAMSFGNSGSDVLYKNIKGQIYIDQKETMGKKFLIKDSISKIEWQMESETKHIGEYLCFKATYTKQIPKKNFNFRSNTKHKEAEETEAEKEPEIIERTVTAWYTPQIPVSNGPSKYQGLPGLILEIQDGNSTIICSKIVINPEEKTEIEKPTKGKEVSQTEYNDIMDRKRKEMMERYAPKKGSKNEGEVIEINFGG